MLPVFQTEKPRLRTLTRCQKVQLWRSRQWGLSLGSWVPRGPRRGWEVRGLGALGEGKGSETLPFPSTPGWARPLRFCRPDSLALSSVSVSRESWSPEGTGAPGTSAAPFRVPPGFSRQPGVREGSVKAFLVNDFPRSLYSWAPMV